MPNPITKPCGTYAAARRHQRRGEVLCDPCIEARRAWWRERAAIAYAIPAWRERENARTAARMRRLRLDPVWRDRADRQRRQRRRAEQAASRLLIDPVAVERACDGIPTPLTRAERLEAVRLLHSRGGTYRHTAELLGIATRQVYRDLTDLGLTSVAS